MVSRRKAIQYVITNRSGTKEQLVRVIGGRMYDEFYKNGFIKDAVLFENKDWVATNYIYQFAYQTEIFINPYTYIFKLYK